MPDASESAAVVEVRTADRAGLLYALGRALSEQRLSIRSAHISTLAGQAIDTFYVTEADGSPPDAARSEAAVQARQTAAAGIVTRTAQPVDAGSLGQSAASAIRSSTSAEVGGCAPRREQTIDAAAAPRRSDASRSSARLDPSRPGSRP